MHSLCALCHHPEKRFATVHVAGTNGKGSVSTKIASALQAQGYTTGLYTSPHISSFRERIRIGGEPITEGELCALFEEIQDVLSPVQNSVTFFEVATLLALLHFAKRQVDVAVIETGIGGTRDATNVIEPKVSIITSIGYDHMDLLGSSLEEIAEEKAGIIKKDTPVVLGYDLPTRLFQKRAQALHAPVHQSLYKSPDYDLENQAIARLGLELLSPHFPLSKTSIQRGLEQRPPCRFERLNRGKEVILDVAHNPHGFAKLLERLSAHYPNRPLRFLLGFCKDKEITPSARLIQDAASAIHLVSSSHPRLARSEELHHYFCSDKCPIHVEPSIADGMAHALKGDKNEVVVVTGSFFIMQEARQALGLNDPIDPPY